MTKEIRVNVSTLVNSSKIRREKRDGRDVIIVPSATLPDDVVMNGSGGKIRYPAAVIAESYHTLEGTPAPLGHPTVNGQFVSASSPGGIVRGFIGAHNENVRRENGRVFMDKVIDVQFANQSDGGKAVLAAIDKEQPIHTSTGLLAKVRPLMNDASADFEAESMTFDHDCILLNGRGAATPDQGVGIFVNSAGDEIEVINCTLTDDIDREMGWAIESMFRAVERKERLGLLEQAKNYITRLVQGGPTPDTTGGDALNNDEETMDQAQFDALSGKVEALSEAITGLDDKIATAVGNALKPVADAFEAQAKATADKAEADRLELVNKVVEAGLLDEAVAKEATAPVLNALLEKAKEPESAFRVNGAFGGTGKADEWKGYDLNAGIDGKGKEAA